MHIVGSALIGYEIEATDGRMGTVKTFLFDDRTWKTRWLVVDTGHWLPGRLVLLHPSSIGPLDHERRHMLVNLTRSQVEASPDIMQDLPVTMQMQSRVYDYYGWDTNWGPDFYGAGAMGLGAVGMSYPLPESNAGVLDADRLAGGADRGDPHLRSMTAVTGYHIHATDGLIGHVENFLLDDATWAIRYLIVDTKNWWPGAHVLISPFAVTSVDWSYSEVRLNVSREQVKASPPWNPAEVVEQVYERRLHKHYGWPGHGW